MEQLRLLTFGGLALFVGGTSTTGPVNWSSGTVRASGSVTFHKTVSVAGPMETSGSLDDTATVTSGGVEMDSDSLSVPITSSASVSLTISKTIPNILGTGQTASFTFDISGTDGYTSQKTLTFSAGETNKSSTITGLAPGTYTVHEEPSTGWNNQDDQEIDLITGALVREAERAGVPVPLHTALYGLVKAREASYS